MYHLVKNTAKKVGVLAPIPCRNVNDVPDFVQSLAILCEKTGVAFFKSRVALWQIKSDGYHISDAHRHLLHEEASLAMQALCKQIY